jgi:hypothetical protein
MALAATAFATEPTSPSVAILKACVARTHDKTFKGLEQFKTDCPDLERAIAELGLADHLAENWRQRLDYRALAGFASLTSRFAGEPPTTGPHVDALSSAMQSLQVHAAPQSWWQRFKSWLRSWYRSSQGQGAEPGLFRRWLARFNLPQSVARAIGYLGIALLLGASLWVVLRELKLAGVLERRSRRARATASGPTRTAPPDRLSDLHAVQALPAWQQPAALLAVLVQTLHQSGRLGLERALTHRQLVERAVFDEGSQRSRFQRVARLAERQLYAAQAARPPAAPEPELLQALADGVSLNAQLRTARGGVR